MKKFVIALVAASVLSSPVLAAPFQGQDNHGRHEQSQRDQFRPGDHRTVVKQTTVREHVRQQEYRSWKKGDRFDSRYARSYRVIDSPRAYRLREAPRGYHWVRSGNDAVLIGVTSGIVASVIANILR